jgi:type IV pilus assembly protein PilY1
MFSDLNNIPLDPLNIKTKGVRLIMDKLKNHALGVVFALICGLSVHADDTEVFLNDNKDIGPNVLFLFDLSGSMLWRVGSDEPPLVGEKSRYEILKSALTKLLNNKEAMGVLNIGLAWFEGDNDIGFHYATGIKWPISHNAKKANTIDSAIAPDKLVSDVLQSILEAQTPDGGTGIVDSMYESTLYFRGEKVTNGAFSPQVWDNAINSYTGGERRAAHPASYSPSNAFDVGGSGSANYVSPITADCQPNHIIMLSDGRPTAINYQTDIESLLGASCVDQSTGILNNVLDWKDSANCALELASFLKDTPQRPAMPKSTVSITTVGFALSNDEEGKAGRAFLKALGKIGIGDKYDAAENIIGFYEQDADNSLADILSEAVGHISASNQSFTPVSIAVNPAKLASSNRTFLSMFKPSHNQTWKGNVKGYYLGDSGLQDANGVGAMELLNGQLVFKDTARSFWSNAEDGNDVERGGASSNIPSTGRKLYTYLAGNSTALTDIDNKIAVSNVNIKATDLGLAALSTERDGLIDWLISAPFADPLHSTPSLINYDGTKKVIFVGTNQGLLHAIDASSPTSDADKFLGGKELFAYIPEQLLSNLNALKENKVWGDHLYGLDGDITVWHDDQNNDFIVNGADTVTLIIGMRRGGSSYYALDVTDIDKPKFKWEINPAKTGFAKLGQTWSRPVLTTIGSKKVLIFGGGYDPLQDSKTTKTPDTKGNAIFIADADTGNLLWSASDVGATLTDANLTYSIPSEIAVIDSDSNGSTDRLYVADLGGQLWRIDLDESNLSGSSITRLANLNTGSAADNIKFFYPPAVALIRSRGESYIALALGSGNRAHPLDLAVQNKMFVYKDKDIEAGVPQSAVLTADLNDFYNASSNHAGGDGTDAQKTTALTALSNQRGWYIELGAGRKALSEPLIFENELMFTTFQPTGVTADVCSAPGNISHYMKMSVKDGVPVDNLDASPDADPLSKTDREKGLNDNGGIPSSPTLVFPDSNDKVEVYVGKELLESSEQIIHRMYWRVNK